MVLLNGLPVIFGAALFHFTALNVFAIGIEYFIIRRKHKIRFLFVRVFFANLISLIGGLLALIFVPDQLNGNIMRSDSPFTDYDRLTLVIGLVALFLINVLLEIPVYLAAKASTEYR